MLDKKYLVLLKTFFYYLGIIGFSFLILRINWTLTFSKVVEAFLSLVVVLILISFKTIQEYLPGIPKVHLRIFLVFFFLLSSAHFIEKEETTFPFLTWGMYGGKFEKPYLDYYDFQGITTEGQRVRIISEEVFPVMMHSRINKKLEYLMQIYHLAKKTGDTQPGPESRGIKKVSSLIFRSFNRKAFSRDEAAEMIDAIIQAVGQEYNLRNRQNPIVAIEINYRTRTLDLEPGIEWTTELIRRIDLTGDFR